MLSMFLASIFSIDNVVNVNVCHRTGSNTNPYNLIVVAVHSVNDANGLNGHGDHPEDAWQSFVFENVTYPGQNEGLFGDIIDDSCNLIVPTPTPTFTLIPPTATYTSTPTDTDVPTATSTLTSTPENTPTSTFTSTPTSTPVTNTPTATVTGDPRTPTPTNTDIPTSTPTLVPTETPMFTPTSTNTPFITLTPTVTETPYPPKPAEANVSAKPYPGIKIGNLVMGKENYNLYLGTNAEDGSLLLPETERGAALYLHTIWVHRAWNSGWLDIRVGDTIYFYSSEGNKELYEVVDTSIIDYGIYPKVNVHGDKFQYIATCYSSDNKMWTDVMLFHLKKMDYRIEK
jgi:hypothetical protein